MKKLERIYEEIAKRHGTTPECVRRDIRSALAAAARNQDPETRGGWESIPHSGAQPTPGEVIAYCSAECIRRLTDSDGETNPP